MSTTSITVAVLAGGAASRFGGQDKGLALLDGRPLVDWVCSAISAMRVNAQSPDDVYLHPLIVANRHRDHYAAFAETIADCIDVGGGPLAGIVSALTHRPDSAQLSLPVDCPTPPLDLAQRLYGQIGSHDCAIVHDGQWRQPLFALYRRGLLDSARTAAQAGQGPSQWQSTLRCIEVDFSGQRDQFRNLNSAEDFARFRLQA